MSNVEMFFLVGPNPPTYPPPPSHRNLDVTFSKPGTIHANGLAHTYFVAAEGQGIYTSTPCHETRGHSRRKGEGQGRVMGGAQSKAGQTRDSGVGGGAADGQARSPAAKNSSAGSAAAAEQQQEAELDKEQQQQQLELGRLRQRLLRPATVLPRPLQPEHEKDHALVLDLMEFFCFAVKVQQQQFGLAGSKVLIVLCVQPPNNKLVHTPRQHNGATASKVLAHLQRALVGGCTPYCLDGRVPLCSFG